jgi:hypothetical protein
MSTSWRFETEDQVSVLVELTAPTAPAVTGGPISSS